MIEDWKLENAKLKQRKENKFSICIFQLSEWKIEIEN